MLKEVVTAEGEMDCGFILMLVLRRLLMVCFIQEVGGVAREALRSLLRVCWLSLTVTVSVKAGAHKLLFNCMANTVPSFVSA